jgi:hypothetical protein
VEDRFETTHLLSGDVKHKNFPHQLATEMAKGLKVFLIFASLVGATIEPSIKECIKGLSCLKFPFLTSSSGSKNGEDWKWFNNLVLHVL